MKQTKKTIIGMKQTVKAIKASKVTEVVIAQDTEDKLIQTLIESAKQDQVPVHDVSPRKAFGNAIGIAVITSVVALTD